MCCSVEEGSSSFLGFSLAVERWCFLLMCRLWPDCTISLLRYKLENRLSLGGALCRRFVAVQTGKDRVSFGGTLHRWLDVVQVRKPVAIDSGEPTAFTMAKITSAIWCQMPRDGQIEQRRKKDCRHSCATDGHCCHSSRRTEVVLSEECSVHRAQPHEV